MSAQHTSGPWRWEVNAKSRQIQLCGGEPRHDLTVIDFTRWGMNGATPRFRQMDEPGMNIMHNALEFAKPAKGREHHADWFQILMHPDAALIEAAPDLLEALESIVAWWDKDERKVDHIEEFEIEEAERKARAAIARAKGEQP